MRKTYDSIEEEFELNKDKKRNKKEKTSTVFTPHIAVIGVGGAGTNAINHLMEMQLENIDFLVANTDTKSLESSSCPNKIHLGLEITKGLGAGSNPEVGLQAAENSQEDITRALEGIDLLFLIAGMGGGTGTGASPVISRIAKELNILTLGFVTKPFNFEGLQRMEIANQGLRELEKTVDSIVVMSNQNLFKVIDENTSMIDAFRVTDDVIYSGVKAIADLITANGMVNLDYNDIKYIIHNGGKAVVTSVEVTGNDKISKITESIMNNPLIDNDINIMNAKKILISIAGGLNMTLYEVDRVIQNLRNKASNSTYLNFGTIFNENMTDSMRVSIIANGIYHDSHEATTLVQEEPVEPLSPNSEDPTTSDDNSIEETEQNDDFPSNPPHNEINVVSDSYYQEDELSNEYMDYSNQQSSMNEPVPAFNETELNDSDSENNHPNISSTSEGNELFSLIEQNSQKYLNENKTSPTTEDNYEPVKARVSKQADRFKSTKGLFELPPFLKQKK